jgi:hypothetical protein
MRSPGQESCDLKDLGYVFAHDVESESPDKPLVQIVSEEESSFHWCHACVSAGILIKISQGRIIDHFRDV